VKRFIYILSIAVITAASCVEQIDNPVVSLEGDKLDLESIISPNEPIQAGVRISYALGSKSSISYPESAEIELMGEGLQGSSLRFSYKSSSNRYILRNQDFRPKVGGEYQIRAFVPDTDIDTILSSTIIPAQVNISDVRIENVEVQDVNGTNDFFFDITIEIDESVNTATWLHIKPTYRTNTSDEYQKFQVLDVETNKNAVSALYLEEGVFVDMTKLDGNTFTFPVSTLVPVKSGTLIKNLYFETRSTTKDYYKYHQTRARQINNSDSGLGSPVTDFTNIENGLGVFAGYSSSNYNTKF